MPLCSTEEAIAEIRQGKMIILVDDEDRENEGDLTMAAEFVTPEAINFMAKFGRGLICLPMSGEMADKLQLPLMAKHNGSRFGTNFTVSIEAREGITTGISAADRATTIKTAVADGAPSRRPGDPRSRLPPARPSRRRAGPAPARPKAAWTWPVWPVSSPPPLSARS